MIRASDKNKDVLELKSVIQIFCSLVLIRRNDTNHQLLISGSGH